jgi:hypothetical protein
MVRKKKNIRYKSVSENEICQGIESEEPLDPVALADCVVEKSINKIRAELNR